MRKSVATFMAVFITSFGMETGFAENPFTEVSPSSWAYQSITQLANEGIINGYPDGTFKGEKQITRYEMAQMVAKAVANENRADAEQQAMINRLADEYTEELDTLGVHINRLEKKVGALQFSGSGRIRYYGLAHGFNTTEYRVRLQFDTKVNDNTAVTAMLTANNSFGQAMNDTAFISNHVYFERAYMTHTFGDTVTAEVGRIGLTIGSGLLYDDMFDGVRVTTKLGNHFNFMGVYGYPIMGGNVDGSLPGHYNFGNNMADHSTALFQLGGNWNSLAASAYYFKGVKQTDFEVYGVAAMTNIHNIHIGGEWATDRNLSDSNAWTARAGYGAYDITKKGTWDVSLNYYYEGVNAPVYMSTYNQAYFTNYKSWGFAADYAIDNNIGIGAEYLFNSKDMNGNKIDDFLYAQMEFMF